MNKNNVEIIEKDDGSFDISFMGERQNIKFDRSDPLSCRFFKIRIKEETLNCTIFYKDIEFFLKNGKINDNFKKFFKPTLGTTADLTNIFYTNYNSNEVDKVRNFITNSGFDYSLYNLGYGEMQICLNVFKKNDNPNMEEFDKYIEKWKKYWNNDQIMRNLRKKYGYSTIKVFTESGITEDPRNINLCSFKNDEQIKKFISNIMSEYNDFDPYKIEIKRHGKYSEDPSNRYANMEVISIHYNGIDITPSLNSCNYFISNINDVGFENIGDINNVGKFDNMPGDTKEEKEKEYIRRKEIRKMNRSALVKVY